MRRSFIYFDENKKEFVIALQEEGDKSFKRHFIGKGKQAIDGISSYSIRPKKDMVDKEIKIDPLSLYLGESKKVCVEVVKDVDEGKKELKQKVIQYVNGEGIKTNLEKLNCKVVGEENYEAYMFDKTSCINEHNIGKLTGKDIEIKPEIDRFGEKKLVINDKSLKNFESVISSGFGNKIEYTLEVENKKPLQKEIDFTKIDKIEECELTINLKNEDVGDFTIYLPKTIKYIKIKGNHNVSTIVSANINGKEGSVVDSVSFEGTINDEEIVEVNMCILNNTSIKSKMVQLQDTIHDTYIETDNIEMIGVNKGKIDFKEEPKINNFNNYYYFDLDVKYNRVPQKKKDLWYDLKQEGLIFRKTALEKKSGHITSMYYNKDDEKWTWFFDKTYNTGLIDSNSTHDSFRK